MRVFIITGQTATGKTKLALELAKKYNGELINFDSRQIYQYLDIITGKDIPKTKIWLYDVVKPDQYFSSFDFVKEVSPIIEDIKNRRKTPILVGGTYLYVKHLLYGIDTNNHSPPDFKLRNKLNDKSIDFLKRLLISLNQKTYNNLNNSDCNNPRRLIRKIEIEKYRKKHNEKIATPSTPPAYIIQQFIGLKYKDKSKLRQAIEKRVEERLKNGAVDEVKKLLKMGYKESDPGIKTIGYQQIIKYIKNFMSLKEAREEWITKELQYAKRQYTFMKKDPNIIWNQID
ncbi:tRNA (adenosine(37)-N6)-dimethylallyltransferase MiaA [Candidatus Roizmanbacteria bacterium]|nr:tRNA (adenosine(37)-N6)-dimethylallyltransferase MiaA [Candidatus Roizmanbacteria bacterium]